MITCRRCRTENPEGERHCSVCGSPLPKPPSRLSLPVPMPFLAVGAAVVLLAVAGLLFFGHRDATRGASPSAGTPSSRAAEPEKGEDGEALPSGSIVVDDILGTAAFRLETTVLKDGWIAVPLWAFLGPTLPVYEDPAGQTFALDEVLWSQGTPVVLCRLELDEAPAAPDIAPVDTSAPLDWRPAGEKEAVAAIVLSATFQAGSAASFVLPREIDRPGIFLQDGRVVGWAFGAGTQNGCLWAGAAGEDLKPMLSAGQLSRTLLYDTRDAHFARAIALPESAPPSARLQALAEGYKHPAASAPGDLPPQLRPDAVIGRMNRLAVELIQKGMSGEVLRVLDDEVLMSAGESTLVRDVCLAMAASGDYEGALKRLARAREEIFAVKVKGGKELDLFEAQVYKDWIGSVLRENGSGGLEIFERARRRFPDDLELNLLGVEAAIADRDWTRAGELLAAKKYPAAWNERIRMYENLIEQGRRDQEAVIVRFDPADENIPVYAYLNDRHTQKFYLDTGAQVTTIPRKTADALGFKIDETTPSVLLRGVGEDVAYEVTLDSIELVGQKVFGVKVYVFDIPSSPEYGLLGIDFLKNFQVDIDHKRGILKLRKK